MKRVLLSILFVLIIASGFASVWIARYLYLHGPEFMRAVKQTPWEQWDRPAENLGLGLFYAFSVVIYIGLCLMFSIYLAQSVFFRSEQKETPKLDKIDLDKMYEELLSRGTVQSGFIQCGKNSDKELK